MSAVRIVLTTIGVGPEAERLARTLVDEHLAACVSILPAMTSFYRWQGSIERETEHQLLIKTTVDRLEPLRARLLALHPYELPELMVLDVAEGSDAYLEWVGQQTHPVP